MLAETSRHEPVISVRVPALLPCKIMADGSVVVPEDYAIENLSVVPVRATHIETSGTPQDAAYELRDGDTVVHSWSSADEPASPLLIGANASKRLEVRISSVSGDGPWRKLAEKAATSGSAEEFCKITYTFEAAS